MADAHAPGGRCLPAVRGRARHPGGGAEAGCGHSPADVAHVRGAHLLAELERADVPGRRQRTQLAEQRLADRFGELPLRGVVFDAAEGRQLGVDDLGQNVVAQQRKVAVHHLVLHARAGSKRGTLGSGDEALEQRLDHLRARMAHVVVDLGELRHDVGRSAAVGDDVVHAGVGGHVLAHQIGHVVHRFGAVERRTPAFRGRGGVGGCAVEAKAPGLVAGAALRHRGVVVAGVPVQHHVHVVEQAGAGHVHLAGTALFRRCSVDAHRARRIAGLQPVRNRDSRDRRCAAEQVVAAGMAGSALDQRLSIRQRRLRQAGQRVELGEDADDRRASAAAGHEGRGQVGDASFHCEAVVLQVAAQERRAAGLQVAELRMLEQLGSQCDGVGTARLHLLDGILRGRRQGKQQADACQCRSHRPFHRDASLLVPPRLSNRLYAARPATRLEMPTPRRPMRSGFRSWPLVQ